MATADTREGRLDVLYRPGQPKTLVATWPTSLAGRTFEVTLGDETLGTSVAGAALTITATALQLAEQVDGTEWRVVETTGGGEVLMWAGWWIPSTRGHAADELAVAVRVDDVEVTVDVHGAPGAEGPAGQGVPAGGTTGQVLAKASDVDYDDEWVDQTEGGGGSGVVETVVAGFGVSVDATDPANPVVTAEVTQAELDAEATARSDGDSALDARLDVIEALGPLATDAEVAALIAALSTVYQPLDSDLTAIAALTTTSFGRSLLTNTDAAAARSALGLGTAAVAASADFQPVDSDLTAIAALSTTAFGRSVLTLADAAALRTAAGLVLGTDIYSKAAVDTIVAALQPLDADLTALAAAGNSAVLAATTASFLTADETKLDGIEAGAEVNDSAAEILTKLLTVDGAGSGLDADLLDGQSSAAFATASGLADHLADTTDAHDASAISIADAANDFTATDVEGALAELQADHEADSTALSDHIGDTSDAHDASAISFSPTGTVAATDVQAAIAEVASEAGGGSVDDTPYDATSWNGVTTTAPSKNAVRDKFEAITGAGGIVDIEQTTLTDKTSWAATSTLEQWGTEEAVLAQASAPAAAKVLAVLSGTARNLDGANNRGGDVRVEISLDGGSSWANGPATYYEIIGSASGNPATGVAAQHVVSGAVTGDIQARARSQVFTATTGPDLIRGIITITVIPA